MPLDSTSTTRIPWNTAKNLEANTFEPISFIVEGYIPEGCTLFAGRPKIGKSWLMLEVALAVATGGHCLGGIQCPRGDVLYLALEDTERRLQDRIAKLTGEKEVNWPESLCYATQWPTLQTGGVDSIRDWIKSTGNPLLVVVDVLARVRQPTNSKQVYQVDYDTIKSLHALSSETSVAIVIVTHVWKGQAGEDPFEKVSGSFGLLGAADTGPRAKSRSTPRSPSSRRPHV
jgi:RecA-family ATPase